MQFKKTDKPVHVYHACVRCNEMFVLHANDVKFLIEKSESDVIETPRLCRFCSSDSSRHFNWGDLMMSEIFSPPREIVSYIGYPIMVNGTWGSDGVFYIDSSVSPSDRDAFVRYQNKIPVIQKVIAGTETRKRDIRKDLERRLVSH